MSQYPIDAGGRAMEDVSHSCVPQIHASEIRKCKKGDIGTVGTSGICFGCVGTSGICFGSTLRIGQRRRL
jgi:hypothetical protein